VNANTPHYSATAIGLHWLMAMALASLFAVGLYMVDLPLSPWKLKVFSWHKWAGVTLFSLALLRLAYRAGHAPPPMPTSMPALQRSAAHFAHILLYVLMIAIPLSGWLMSSAKGFQTVLFGVLPIPDLLEKDKELGKVLEFVHHTLNYLLAALVAGHAGAAIKHHLIDKDDVLARMLPWRTASGHGRESAP